MAAAPYASHPGVAWLVAAAPDGAAVVGDDGEVKVGRLSPDLSRPENLVLPHVGGPPGVERRQQVARHTAEIGPIRHEADRYQVAMRPSIARSRIRYEPRFQLLDAGASARGLTGLRLTTSRPIA